MRRRGEDVFCHGQMIEEMEVLVDDTDAEILGLTWVTQPPAFSIDDYESRIRRQSPGQDSDQCAFPGTVLAKERVNFATSNIEVD
jgi:hypothetical protein